MELAYEALDQQGKPVQDVVSAGSVDEALQELHRLGLFVKNIEPSRQRKTNIAKGSSSKTKLPIQQLVFFTKQVNMLLKAGSSVVPALRTVRLQMKKPEHLDMIDTLTREVEGGSSLSEAMAKYPKCFDSGYRAIVAAGEASAALPEMFERLAGILTKRKGVRSKLIGAMTYPILLICLSVGVVNTLLLFVIPRFAGLFSTLGADMPASTKFFLGLSEFLLAYWQYLAAGFGAAVVLVIWMIKSQRGRRFITDVQTEIPIVGRFMSRLIQGEVFRTLGMLLECRVGLLDALDLTRGVSSNARFQLLFDNIQNGITEGRSMSSALKGASYIDPILSHSVEIGEENGHLSAAVSYCADILEEENAEMIATATKLIEPIILLGMGVVVGGVAISLFMPLFDLTSAIN